MRYYIPITKCDNSDDYQRALMRDGEKYITDADIAQTDTVVFPRTDLNGRIHDQCGHDACEMVGDFSGLFLQVEAAG